MATKKSSSMVGGGVLVFLGSLLYLYLMYILYNSGGSAWLGGYAQFWTPIVAAIAVVTAISLFFMSLGMMASRMGGDAMRQKVLWNAIMAAGITFAIWAAGGSLFWFAVLGFAVTYVGAAWAMM